MVSLPEDALGKILLLSSLVSADMARFEESSGLTGARVRLLWVLGAHGPCTQQALAGQLEVTPRNVTGLVDGLVDSGHVTREPHPTDRRALLVTPTAAGESLIAQLRAGQRQLAADLFGDVSEGLLADFVATLDETIARFAALMEDTR